MTEQNESTPPLDEESLRLLNELENGTEGGDGEGVDGAIADAKAEEKKTAPAKKKAVKKKAAPAKKKAVKKKAKPKASPESAAPAAAIQSAPVEYPTITNVSKNHRRICRVDLAVGESYTLTAEDLEDERLMAKLARAVELGVLEVD